VGWPHIGPVGSIAWAFDAGRGLRPSSPPVGRRAGAGCSPASTERFAVCSHHFTAMAAVSNHNPTIARTAWRRLAPSLLCISIVPPWSYIPAALALSDGGHLRSRRAVRVANMARSASPLSALANPRFEWSVYFRERAGHHRCPRQLLVIWWGSKRHARRPWSAGGLIAAFAYDHSQSAMELPSAYQNRRN